MMGDGADMALSNAADEDEHYHRYQYEDMGTQYDEGLIDEHGATIGNPSSFPGRSIKRNVTGEGNCPICGGSTTLKQGRFGNFYGCDKFPKCKGSRSS